MSTNSVDVVEPIARFVRRSVTSALFSPDEQWLIVVEAGEELRLHCFESATGRLVFEKEFAGKYAGVFWQGNETLWVGYFQSEPPQLVLVAVAIPDGGEARSICGLEGAVEEHLVQGGENGVGLALVSTWRGNGASGPDVSLVDLEQGTILWTLTQQQLNPPVRENESFVGGAFHPDGMGVLLFPTFSTCLVLIDRGGNELFRYDDGGHHFVTSVRWMSPREVLVIRERMEGKPRGVELLLIDLTEKKAVWTLPLSLANGAASNACVDIAFHDDTRLLLGAWSSLTEELGALYEFDPATKKLRSLSLPKQTSRFALLGDSTYLCFSENADRWSVEQRSIETQSNNATWEFPRVGKSLLIEPSSKGTYLLVMTSPKKRNPSKLEWYSTKSLGFSIEPSAGK